MYYFFALVYEHASTDKNKNNNGTQVLVVKTLQNIFNIEFHVIVNNKNVDIFHLAKILCISEMPE